MASRQSSAGGLPVKPFKPPTRTRSGPSTRSDRDDTLLHPSTTTTRPRQPQAQSSLRPTPDSNPAIPPKLVAKLLYDQFEDKSMKVEKLALVAMTKYVETFVREAIARACLVREKGNEVGLGTGDHFVEVEDLEKLAPQLLLDF